MYSYLKKVTSIVKATDEKSWIRIRTKMSRIHNNTQKLSRFSIVNGAILRMNQAGTTT
jgi:uncharacterized ubiquitin-like protein YukD